MVNVCVLVDWTINQPSYTFSNDIPTHLNVYFEPFLSSITEAKFLAFLCAWHQQILFFAKPSVYICNCYEITQWTKDYDIISKWEWLIWRFTHVCLYCNINLLYIFRYWIYSDRWCNNLVVQKVKLVVVVWGNPNTLKWYLQSGANQRTGWKLPLGYWLCVLGLIGFHWFLLVFCPNYYSFSVPLFNSLVLYKRFSLCGLRKVCCT